jgi:hypothetical protein
VNTKAAQYLSALSFAYEQVNVLNHVSLPFSTKILCCDNPHIVLHLVAGWQWTYSGRTDEAGETEKTPHWRAIFDDKGRVMVAICHNMDLGDAWEWSDDPRYPEKWAALAYRTAMNHFIYDLTY